MRKMMFALFVFCFIRAYAESPLPEALLNAKTAFVSNGGASEKDFDKFCKILKKWGRFELVRGEKSPDIIIELSAGSGSDNIFGYGGVKTGSYSWEINFLRIIDARDHTMLWTDKTTKFSKNPAILISNLKSKMKKK